MGCYVNTIKTVDHNDPPLHYCNEFTFSAFTYIGTLFSSHLNGKKCPNQPEITLNNIIFAHFFKMLYYYTVLLKLECYCITCISEKTLGCLLNLTCSHFNCCKHHVLQFCHSGSLREN